MIGRVAGKEFGEVGRVQLRLDLVGYSEDMGFIYCTMGRHGSVE